MDREELVGRDGAGFIDRFPDDVENSPERCLPDGDADALAHVAHLLPANETLGGVHGDAAHGFLSEVLRHFDDEGFPADR